MFRQDAKLMKQRSEYEGTDHFKTETVEISIDGEVLVYDTHANTLADFMMEHNWDVQEHDLIEPALETEITDSMEVVWKQAKEVLVTIDGKQETVWTIEDTVEALFAELNITYTEHDHIFPAVTTDITESLEVLFESAFQGLLKYYEENPSFIQDAKDAWERLKKKALEDDVILVGVSEEITTENLIKTESFKGLEKAYTYDRDILFGVMEVFAKLAMIAYLDRKSVV